jgi:L-ascorbate metabolism protein UlaG (beta-lactamase superfamily)
VLSHHHGDHFDPLVVERLSTDLPIITEPPSAPKLVRQGFRRAIPVQTWSSTTVRRGDTWIRITSLPAKHAPQPLRLLLPKVMGSMLECGTGDGDVSFRLYITGTRSTTRTWSRSVIGIPTSTCV